MITDRGRQVEEILSSALMRQGSERSDVICEMCAGNLDLRRDVEAIFRSVALLAELADSRHTRATGNLLAIGSSVGPYRILAKHGAGGMGEVYLAEDTRLRRKVAIKVLFGHGNPVQDNEALLREARVASALNHPNICTVYEIADQAGRALLVMEWLEGRPLDAQIGQHPVPIHECLTLAAEILEALEAAHAAGVIHSDLKPSNVFITSHGHAKLLDFGVAKHVRALVDPSEPAVATDRTDWSAEPSVRGGTLAYMSPEHIRREAIDARSDVFSAGLVLYEMATGRPAFRGPNPWNVAHLILFDRPLAPLEHNPRLPPELVAIIDRAIEKNRDLRYQSAADMRADRARVRLGLPPGAAPSSGSSSRTSRTANLQAEGESFRMQRLTFGRGTVYSARFALDGQTIVYSAAWSGGPMRLYLTRPEHPESRPFGPTEPHNVDVLSISPAGELAISLDRRLLGLVKTGMLAQVPFAGGAPRPIQPDIQEADWIANERTLAVVRRTANTSRIEFPMGHVVHEAACINGMRVSRDGRRVAFVQHRTRVEDDGDVGVIEAGKASVLSKGWSSVEGAAWSPDGNEIWFTAAEPGAERALRAVDLEGRTRTLARFPHRMTLLDAWRDSRILVSDARASVIMEAQTATDRRPIDLTLFDRSSVRDLSADGRTVLFDESGEAGGERWGVYVRTVTGDPPVRIADGLGIALSPDGESAITASRTRTALFVVAVRPGAPHALDAGDITQFLTAAWLPGQNRVVVCGAEGERPFRLYVQSVDGKPKPISPAGVIGPAAVSPDGRLAVGIDDARRIWLYPVDGGDAMPVPGIETSELPVQWSADGRALFLRPRGGALPLPITRYDLRSGKRRLMRTLTIAEPTGVLKIAHAVLTRDARTFVYGYMRTLSDLYLVSGLG